MRRLFSVQLKQGYLVESLKSSLRKFNGRYGDLIQKNEVSLSQMANGILTLDQLHWCPYQSNFNQLHDLVTELDLHRITSGIHGAFATDVACRQGMVTLPDTLIHPFLDFLMLKLLRPVFPKLPCLFSTFHLNMVLSRYCVEQL